MKNEFSGYIFRNNKIRYFVDLNGLILKYITFKKFV